MHKFGRMLRLDLHRALFSLSALFVIVGTVLVQLHKTFDWMFESENGNSALYLYEFGTQAGRMHVLMALVAAMGYGAAYYQDLRNNCLNGMLLRQSVGCYTASKVISVFIATMLQVVLGHVIYLIILCHGREFTTARDTMIMAKDLSGGDLLLSGNFVGFFALNFAIKGMMAGFWACLSLCLSAFIQNRYVVRLGPLALTYLTDPLLPTINGLSLNSIGMCVTYIGDPWRALTLSSAVIIGATLIEAVIFHLRVRKEVLG